MKKYLHILLSILLAGAHAGLDAQQVTGTILGRVVDSSGAAVSGAQITISNQDTGAVRNVVSGGDGEYNAPQIPAGAYTIEARTPGFSLIQVKDVVVTVASDTRVDLKVQVGSISQTVTVSDAAPLLDTTNSSVGGTVDQRRVTDLPLNGRNWSDLTLLQPGVQTSLATLQNINGVANNPGMAGNAFSVNGATTHSNFISLDGANMLSLMSVNSASVIGTNLGVDGIKEFKVVTNMFGAEYGMLMGSQTTIVSKGGTNQFHGDVFEYLRNSALDARNYFDALDTANANGFGTNKSFPYPGKRIPPFRRNNFGGSFGGPIKKDKTFFFGTFEDVQEQIGNTITTQTIPEACFVDQNGALHTQIPAQIKNSNQFGTCASGAPSTIALSPYILPLADEFPAPTVIGYPTFNYTFPFLAPESEYYGQVRVDHTFSTADSLFARYTQDNAYALGPSGGYLQYTVASTSISQFATLSETHVFSPSLLNTARLSYSQTLLANIALQNQSVNSANLRLVSGSQASVTGLLNGDVNPGSGVTGTGPLFTYPARPVQGIFTLADDVFQDHGKHSLKFGTLMNHYIVNVTACQTCNGSVSFTSLADFFTGDYSSFTYNIPNDNPVRHFLFNTFGFYGQDDYRVSSRVALNLGLRYEINTVPHDPNPAEAYSLRFPSDPAGTPGNMFRNFSLLGFSPRLGFAWDVRGNGKTSVKGGAGIYYDVASFGYMLYSNAISAPPIASPITISNSLATPQIPFTVPLPIETAKLAPRTVDYNLKEPTMYQYNLAVQQELPWGMALSIGYVGSRGVHLYQLKEANPIVPVGLEANGNPIFGCWNTADTLSAPLTSTGACPANFTNVGPRTYSDWLTVSRIQSTGISYYNALQTQVNKRLSQGLDFQVSYTWEKLLGTGSELAFAEALSNQGQLPAGYNERTDRGPLVYEVPQSIRVNVIYYVPAIKSNFAGNFVNGWWFSTIVSAQSGDPFTPTISSDRALEATTSSTPTEHPNLDPSFSPSKAVTHNPTQWFKPTLFDLQPAGTLGNSGVGILSGPGLENVNFSAVKDTKARFLGEGGSVQFRAEFFNLLNHANFGLPTATVYSGSGAAGAAPAGQIGTTVGGTALTPFATAGHISSTVTTSRQIQFAVKLIF